MPKRVIIVDDDREVREIVSFALTQSGFAVIEAQSGSQLQELLAHTDILPDLIILDVMMPGEDGYHICHNLRNDSRTSNIPVMMMTAHAEDIYARISTDLGAAGHITKPFHPFALVEKVKTLLHE